MLYHDWLKARTSGRFTQAALADVLTGEGAPTNQPQVSAWLSGRAIPRPYKARILHRLLSADEADLAVARHLYAEADRVRAEAA